MNLWKIYFWTIVPLQLLGLVSASSSLLQRYNILEILVGIITIPLTSLAIYSFAYKKSIFKKRFWYYYFWISILVFGLWMIYALFKEDNVISAFQKGYAQFGIIFAIAIVLLETFSVVIPFYIIYKLGHSKKE